VRAIDAIDHALMSGIYAPIAEMAGRRFGSTAGSLARACVAPMIVFGAINAVTSYTIAGEIVLLLLGLQNAASCWFAADRADLIPNPLAEEPPLFRVLIVAICGSGMVISHAISPAPVHDLAFDFYLAAYASHFYFRALPSPPPKKRPGRARVKASQAIAPAGAG